MRALVIAYHVYPDPAVGAKRVSELANYLAGNGWAIDIICAEPGVSDSLGSLRSGVMRFGIVQPRSLVLQLLDIVRRLRSFVSPVRRELIAAPGAVTSGAEKGGLRSRLERIESGYHQLVGLCDDCKRWSSMAWRQALRLPNHPDLIFASGPPWSPVVAAWLVARLHKVPLVIDLRDPWAQVDTAGQGGVISRLQNAVMTRLERRVVGTAAAVVVTTGRLRQQLQNRYRSKTESIFLLRNGFDSGMLITEPMPTGKLALLFAGTVYFHRNPLPLLDGLAELLANPAVDRARVSLKLVGDCATYAGVPLTWHIAQRGLGDVVMVDGLVTGARVRELTTDANVIVNFAQGQRDQVPAKLYEQIASGRYGLLFAEPDSESAVLSAGVGSIRRVDDDVVQVRAELQRLYDLLVTDGVNAARLHPPAVDLEPFRREVVNAAYARLIQQVCADQ